MFQLWEGYDIDGSDTSYDLRIPSRAQVLELAAFYLDLPIWDPTAAVSLRTTPGWAPHRTADLSGPPALTRQAILETLRSPAAHGSFTLISRCRPAALLPPDLQDTLRGLSQTRPELEPAAQRPGASIAGNLSLNDAALGVDLTFNLEAVDCGEYETPTGMILNEESLTQQLLASRSFQASFGCGPSFYYEYAAYIVRALAERFPEVGISGGLDCGGGFLNGCTYAASLYQYDRIPVGEGGSLDRLMLELQDLVSRDLIRLPSSPLWPPGRKPRTFSADRLCLVNALSGLPEAADALQDEATYAQLYAMVESEYRISLDQWRGLLELLLHRPDYARLPLPILAAVYVTFPQPGSPPLDLTAKRVKQPPKTNPTTEDYRHEGFLTVVLEAGNPRLELRCSWHIADEVKARLAGLPLEVP